MAAKRILVRGVVKNTNLPYAAELLCKECEQTFFVMLATQCEVKFYFKRIHGIPIPLKDINANKEAYLKLKFSWWCPKWVVSLLAVHGKMEGTVWEAQEEDYPWRNNN